MTKILEINWCGDCYNHSRSEHNYGRPFCNAFHPSKNIPEEIWAIEHHPLWCPLPDKEVTK